MSKDYEDLNYFEDNSPKCPGCGGYITDTGFYDTRYVNYEYNEDTKHYEIESQESLYNTSYKCNICDTALPMEIMKSIELLMEA